MDWPTRLNTKVMCMYTSSHATPGEPICGGTRASIYHRLASPQMTWGFGCQATLV
ncbi:hypothetical protein BgiMline_017346, partial [Biomphalaria glabrata]